MWTQKLLEITLIYKPTPTHFSPNDATFELFTSLSFLAYAKQKHLTLFDKIAAEHARIGEEQLAARLAFEATSIRYEEE